MTAPATSGRRAPGRVLKSPLAVPGAAHASSYPDFGSLPFAHGRAALTDREATLAEFQGYLRTVNNRDGRPFEEKTITAYSDPVKSLTVCQTSPAAVGGQQPGAGRVPARRRPHHGPDLTATRAITIHASASQVWTHCP